MLILSVRHVLEKNSTRRFGVTTVKSAQSKVAYLAREYVICEALNKSKKPHRVSLVGLFY